MKKCKLVLMLAFAFCISFAHGQTSTAKANDGSKLMLAAWVPNQIDNMPEAARKNLENKLTQIVTANGMSGDARNTRFIVSANVVVATKDITPTAPPMHAYTLDVTLYMGDGFEGKSYASYSTTVKGVGENETKAYNAALKNIKTTDPNYKDFIDKGKAKIIDYYNSQCDIIIKEAKVLAAMNKFDEAIWKLTSVPNVCTDCFNKSMIAVAPIFQQKIDFVCKTNVSKATSIWNANPTAEGAAEAGELLSKIDPNAACFKESKALSDKIGKRMLEIDKREWNFKYDSEIGLERDMIKAYRDVGVAYGNGQPQNVTYKSLW